MSVDSIAAECGVDERTARRRVAKARVYKSLTKEQRKAVDESPDSAKALKVVVGQKNLKRTLCPF